MRGHGLAGLCWLLAAASAAAGCRTWDAVGESQVLEVTDTDALTLHPPRVYPPGTPFAGQHIDTLLSAPPVEPDAALARKFFPDFDPARERVFSNVSSGIEGEFYVVKVP